MNGRARRLAALVTACLLLCAQLSGCVHMTFENEEGLQDVVLPDPTSMEAVAPIGDSRARYSLRTLLYYMNTEGQLTSALRLLYILQDDDPLESVLDALLEKPYSSSGLLAVAPEGTKRIECTLSEGVATVNLTAEALAGDNGELFWTLRCAVIKTLLEQSGVKAVNVLVEGRACEYNGYPVGASTEQDANIAAKRAQWDTEYEKFKQGGEGASLERECVMYLPEPQGDVLLSTVADARFQNADYASGLIAAWLDTARARGFDPVYLPVDALGATAADVSISPNGTRILSLRLPDAVVGAGDGAISRSACALALTLCRFLPNIDGVRIYAGANALAELDLPGERVSSDSGVFPPSRLEQAIGSSVTLHIPTDGGRLQRTVRATKGLTHTPRELLSMLDANASRLLPEGVDISDILGIRIEEGVAYINLSSNLYSLCQSFSEDQESAFLYAIVNTVVDNFTTVSRVQFYVAGGYADLFAGSLSIRCPLMPNPGIAVG